MTIIEILAVVIATALSTLAVMIVRYIFIKGEVEFSKEQEARLDKVLYNIVLSVEQQALAAKKFEQKNITPEEKLQMAQDMLNKLCDAIKILKPLKPFVLPMIEGKLKQLLIEGQLPS